MPDDRDAWHYWPLRQPELNAMIEWVAGNDESPSRDPPEIGPASDLIFQERQGRAMTDVWWRERP